MFQDIGRKVIMEVVTSWIIDRPFFRKKKKKKKREPSMSLGLLQ